MISTFLFGLVNHFGDLPGWALQYLSFSAGVPIWQWFYRSMTSDLLFFSPEHFWSVGILYFFALRWLEWTEKLRFVIPFIFLAHFFDDFINYFLIIKPFHFIEVDLYNKFIASKDVGSSLCLMLVIGYQINSRARKNREFIFVLIVLVTLMGSLFTTLLFSTLVLNINHLIFLLLGYLVGKFKFEHMRKESKRTAKIKHE